MSRQKAPCVLGEVSPTLAWPKAPTNSPWLTLPLAEVAHFSRSCAATPLLSPEISLLVLLMEVQCTGNQATEPLPLHTCRIESQYVWGIPPQSKNVDLRTCD